MTTQKQRYHIWTEGCQMNVADSAKLAAGLDRLGWTATEEVTDASLVVLNTCVVRERSELRVDGYSFVVYSASTTSPWSPPGWAPPDGGGVPAPGALPVFL